MLAISWQDVPYHCFPHGVDVLFTVFRLLQLTGAGTVMTILDLFSWCWTIWRQDSMEFSTVLSTSMWRYSHEASGRAESSSTPCWWPRFATTWGTSGAPSRGL